MTSQPLTPEDGEIQEEVTKIVAMIPMFTGAKLTEVGWEKYGENEQDAIKKLVEFIKQRDQKKELELRKTTYESIHTIHMAHDWNETSQDLVNWLNAERQRINHVEPPSNPQKGK